MVTKREVVRQNIKIFVFMVVLIVTAGSFQVFCLGMRILCILVLIWWMRL